MIWLILIVIVVILAYKFGKRSGETISFVSNSGGMRLKYSKLIKHILEGHPECKIIVETRTYIRLGVSNYGGTTMFHIQQCPKNTVMIDYEVVNNPIIPNFSLRFTFPDTMDQDKMMEKIVSAVNKKMMTKFF